MHLLEASLPIVQVTVLEDRAHVVRRGRVMLAAGQTRLSIAGVAPVLSDKTLLARAAGDGDARVVDARVRRVKLSREEDAAEAGTREALRRELEQLGDHIEALEQERAAAEERRQLLDRLAELTLAELAADVAWGKPCDGLGPEARKLSEERRALCRRLVELDRDIERETQKAARLRRRIATLDTPSAEMTAQFEVDVTAERAGERELSVDYLVPNACWRPYHRAQLFEGELCFETEACVWQRSGEAWAEVELVLSTERASLGAEPPELISDRLRVRKRRDVLAVQKREQKVDKAAVIGERVAEPPGIDDGGEALELRASSRASVPSDGRPHRVPLAAFSVPITTSLESTPELSPYVMLKSVQSNAGSGPILAGPVDLVRQAGLAGRTSVLFVGPGERFELGWGPESELRVSRSVELENTDTGLLGTWVAHKHHVEVRLSNLGASERRVHVRERVPVSEIEKVKIELHPKETSEAKRPDRDGFVDWEVTLAPFGKAKLELCYTLRKHADVVGL